MANVELDIAGRKYAIACRDGEEEHLRSVAVTVSRKAQDAEAALGNMGEARQLLFACLLLADDLHEARNGKMPEPEPDPQVAETLERLAERMELLAQSLESRA
jgi:cell division protein ZapA